MTKIIGIALTLLLSASCIEAVRHKQSIRNKKSISKKAAKQHHRENPGDDPVDEIREQLEEYAALSPEEKRARTDEIWDFVGSLIDKMGSDGGESEGGTSSGPEVDQGNAREVASLINQFRPRIS